MPGENRITPFGAQELVKASGSLFNQKGQSITVREDTVLTSLTGQDNATPPNTGIDLLAAWNITGETLKVTDPSLFVKYGWLITSVEVDSGSIWLNS